jgi:hypothetical protein
VTGSCNEPAWPEPNVKRFVLILMRALAAPSL